MKKIITSLLCCLLVITCMLSATSCLPLSLFFDDDSEINEETNEIPDGATVNVNGGDNYNVTIQGDSSTTVAAAKKALLSAVSSLRARIQAGAALEAHPAHPRHSPAAPALYTSLIRTRVRRTLSPTITLCTTPPTVLAQASRCSFTDMRDTASVPCRQRTLADLFPMISQSSR